MFKPVFVGLSPAGVEWVAYKPEHVEKLRTRLAAVWFKHEAKKVFRRLEWEKAVARFGLS